MSTQLDSTSAATAEAPDKGVGLWCFVRRFFSKTDRRRAAEVSCSDDRARVEPKNLRSSDEAEMLNATATSSDAWRCPHCGSEKGIWFDRSFMIDSKGDEVPEESFPDRCLDCGRNIDAPPSYYA